MKTRNEARFRFPKDQRLRRRPEYKACYAHGRRYFSSRFIFFVLKRPPDGRGLRLGTAVSKKIGKAVRRNRVKRLLREYFRLHRRDTTGDIDLVVVPKRGIEARTLGFSDLEKELNPILRRLHEDCAAKKE